MDKNDGLHSNCFVGGACFICYLSTFPYTGVPHDFHYRLFSCRFTVTRRVSLVEYELVTLPDHMSSPLAFSGVSVAQSVVFSVLFRRPLYVILFNFFSLLKAVDRFRMVMGMQTRVVYG